MRSTNLSLKIKEFEKKQILFAVISLIFLCAVAVVLNQLHLSSLAEESTKYLTRHISMGDRREIAIMLNQAHLSNFKVIRYISKNTEKNFTIPARADLENESNFGNIFNGKVTTEVRSVESSSDGDKIVYEYNRFRLIPYSFLIWIFLLLMSIPQFIYLKRKLVDQFEKDVETERKVAKAEIARIVRHNLRTPLAALNRVPDRLPDSLKDERDLVNAISNQIKDLVGQLDESKSQELSKKQDLNIYDTLLSAKQELKEIIPDQIDFKFDIEDIVSSDLVIHIPFELRSIISNMVLNSIEAIETKGKIVIKAYEYLDQLVIKISDTGWGIPSELINQIFEKDFSYNKEKGSGIGLHHAKQFIESWAGKIQVESLEGSGTTFTITLPVEDKASWFLPRIKIKEDSKIFVLDDQRSALMFWKQKLEEKFKESGVDSNPNERIQLFDKVEDFKSKSDSFDNGSIFLIDYDLGQDINGLDVLNSIPRPYIRCLVTGHFDDIEIRDECARSGIFLIPKSSIDKLVLV